MKSVCHISSLHGLYDDRIYWKEAVSLSRNGYKVIHIGAGEEAKDVISPDSIRLICLPLKRYFANPYLDILFRRLTFRPGIYKKMLKVCADLKADAYHIHDIQVNRIGFRLQRLPHRPKVVYDVHEDYADQMLSHFPKSGLIRMLVKRYGLWLNRWEAAHALKYDAVIAAVDHIYQKFHEAARQGKAITLYNYTTLEPVGLTDYNSRKFDAIYAGQISEPRGALQVAKAVTIARRIIPTLRVLMLGPVPDPRFRKKLEDFITTEGLSEHLILGGQVPHSEIGNYYRDSRIGLGIFLPLSIFEYGLQVKTFEYLACGLPVLCSNFGSLYRIILETGAGISADPQSPESICQALVTLLTDRDLYEKLSANAQQAAKRYSWRNEERKLLALYRDILQLLPDA